MLAYVPSSLVAFVPASSLGIGGYIVDGEGLVYRINEVRRDRGCVSFGLDRHAFLVFPPTKIGRVRASTKIRTLSPEGEAIHEGREFSWLPGHGPQKIVVRAGDD